MTETRLSLERVQELAALTSLPDEALSGAAQKAADELLTDLCSLAAETLALRDALAFYADGGNWTMPAYFGGVIFDDESAAIQDMGGRARVALDPESFA